MLVACDRSYPVCIALVGGQQRLASWPIDERFRRRPVSADVRVVGSSVWIAAPAAGGLVRWDLDDDSVRIVPLDAPPGSLAELGGDVLVVAHPDWVAMTDGDRGEIGFQHPTEDREEEPSSFWFGTGAYAATDDEPDDDDQGDDQDDDEDQDDDGSSLRDSIILETERPVWRIRDGEPIRLDVGGDLHDMAATDSGRLVAGVRRPDDPLIRSFGDDSVSYGYPQGIVAFDESGNATTLGRSTNEVQTFADGDDVWVAYREGEGSVRQLARVDLTTAELIPSTVELGRGHLVAVIGSVAVLVEIGRGSRVDEPETTNVRLVDLRDGSARQVAMAPVEIWHAPAPAPGRLWFIGRDEPVLVGLEIGSGHVEIVDSSVEIGDRIPVATPEPGEDPVAAAERATDALRSELLGGWTNGTSTRPFITGITIDSVTTIGSFPDTVIEIRFRSDAHGLLEFATEIRVFDRLGNTLDLKYAGINLMEEIEGGGGLPPIERCRVGDDGLVRVALDDW